jgi:truncated hemoglobin YjbI
MKPDEEPIKSLLDKLGGPNGIKEITEKTMTKVLACPKLKPFFDSTPIGLHSKRLAYYIMSIIGGSDYEWIGRSLK